MKKELTCINCPLGCTVTVSMDDKGNIENITGNTCKRGEIYARNEVKNPVRMVTSTVRVERGKTYSVPVKTENAIPKDKIKEVMIEINKAKANAPVHIGDIIIKNIADTGIALIATANRN